MDDLSCQDRRARASSSPGTLRCCPAIADVLLGEIERLRARRDAHRAAQRRRGPVPRQRSSAAGRASTSSNDARPPRSDRSSRWRRAAAVGEGGAGVSFPTGARPASSAVPAERERIRWRDTGRAVGLRPVMVARPDRYARAPRRRHLRQGLAGQLVRGQNIPYAPWERLADVAEWLEMALTDGRLPAARAPTSWAAEARPEAETFICGPEVWGPSRTVAGRAPGSSADAMGVLDEAEEVPRSRPPRVARPRWPSITVGPEGVAGPVQARTRQSRHRLRTRVPRPFCFGSMNFRLSARRR